MTEVTELKLCKDCKHCERRDSLTKVHEYSRCSIITRSIDRVSGEHELVFCEHARYSSGRCKGAALLFEPIGQSKIEPKLSLWYKLKNIFRKPI